MLMITRLHKRSNGMMKWNLAACLLMLDAQQNNSCANTTVTLNIACPHTAQVKFMGSIGKLGKSVWCSVSIIAMCHGQEGSLSSKRDCGEGVQYNLCTDIRSFTHAGMLRSEHTHTVSQRPCSTWMLFISLSQGNMHNWKSVCLGLLHPSHTPKHTQRSIFFWVSSHTLGLKCGCAFFHSYTPSCSAAVTVYRMVVGNSVIL